MLRIVWLLAWVLIAALLIWMGIHNLRLGNQTGWVVLIIGIAWMAIPALFFIRERPAMYISVGAAACFGLLLCVQSARRIWFILENGGMDSATQPRSPMAFLIGWVSEWVCLGIPAATLLAIPLLRDLTRGDGNG